MNRMYLVQRGTFKRDLMSIDKSWPFGQDKMISLDYMGSAEFEWGAPYLSLKRMTKDRYEYHIHAIEDIKHYKTNNPLLVFCKDSEFENIKNELHKYLQGNDPHDISTYRLKESISFHYLVTGQYTRWARNDNFWWDIDDGNDFMFFFAKKDGYKHRLFIEQMHAAFAVIEDQLNKKQY